MLGVGRVMVASFTGRGHPHYALAVGLLSFPATLVAYLLVIPDYGTTGAAVVTSLSYAAAALLAAVLFFRTVHTSRREALVPTREDVRDYESYAQATALAAALALLGAIPVDEGKIALDLARAAAHSRPARRARARGGATRCRRRDRRRRSPLSASGS